MLKIFYELINIHLDIKKSKSTVDVLQLRFAETKLIRKNPWIAILSALVSVQINKPLCIPIFFLVLIFKVGSHSKLFFMITS